MRVKKTTPAGTVLYGWENDRIFAEYNANGTAIQETVYLGSTPIALLKEGSNYRIFVDQIDTPRVLTDNSNAVLWAWVSKPFGESQPNEDVDGDNTKLSYNLRFPGQYYDGETGKHYNFNRDYNPATGRYVQSDPIGLDGGMNLFVYVNGNPVIIFDPTGELGWKDATKKIAEAVFVIIEAFSDGDPKLSGRKIEAELKRREQTEQIIERKKKKRGSFSFFLDPFDLAIGVLKESCFQGDLNSCSTYEWATGEDLGIIYM